MAALRWLAAFALVARTLAAQAPVWASPEMFWYRKPVAGGDRWMRVDARAGFRDQLFDHTRLARELSSKTGADFTALTLPFADPGAHLVVKFDGGNTMNAGTMALEFVLGGELWRCEMQAEWDWGKASDYDCNSLGAFDRIEGPMQDSDPHVSPDGKWEALVVDGNVVVRRTGTTETTILSRDGTPAFAYQAGSLAWSDDSKSVSAYRVSSAIWTTGSPGDVRRFLVRGTWLVR